jgi:hypothetical protein
MVETGSALTETLPVPKAEAFWALMRPPLMVVPPE